MKVTIEEIMKTICVYYGVTEEDLKSKSRQKTIARPRQMFMHLAKAYTSASYKKIGEMVDRDHATVIWAYNKFLEYMTPMERGEWAALTTQIEENKPLIDPHVRMWNTLGRYFMITKTADFSNELTNLGNGKDTRRTKV